MADRFDDHHGTLLGRPIEYASSYDPSLLQPIERRLARRQLGLDADLPFHGVDIWTAYEVSWLNARGKPQVAVADFRVPADSRAIIESKSFKLYLNSFNQTRFAGHTEVVGALQADLSAAAGAAVRVDLPGLQESTRRPIGSFVAECIDDEDIEVDAYTPDAELLSVDESRQVVEESLYSDLLKSNCPVTGQPDWASVLVRYRGPRIIRSSLLRYIISFRQHQDFHEHCVERMFLDIKSRCQTESLTVYARYTRRGGLDINPFRSDCSDAPEAVRLVRQ